MKAYLLGEKLGHSFSPQIHHMLGDYAYALRELVKAICIEAPDKSSGKRHQGIRISYVRVGFIPVEELLKQETA